MLGKYQAELSPKYWKEFNHLLYYIKITVDYSVLIPSKCDYPGLKTWINADWVRDETKRRSRSGALVFYYVKPFIRLCNLQTAMAIYISDAEYSSLSSHMCEITWLRIVLSEDGCGENTKPAVMKDILC